VTDEEFHQLLHSFVVRHFYAQRILKNQEYQKLSETLLKAFFPDD